MPLTAIPTETLDAARAASADARTRYAAGDGNMSEAETAALASLAQAMKDSGVAGSPLEILVDVCVNPLSWRGSVSP